MDWFITPSPSCHCLLSLQPLCASLSSISSLLFQKHYNYRKMANRGVLVGGVAVAGVAGYYLYSAGGDPKVAEKKFESDATTASNKIRSQLPGSAQEAKSDAKLFGEEARSKAEQTYKDAKNTASSYASSTEKKLNELSKETGTKINSAVDKFDKSVEKGAANTKSTVSSWFGWK